MIGSIESIAASAPPWNLIHFDVRCARCGHDLRGQTDPVCPACKLEFSWCDAAPLEKLTCAKCNYHLYGLSDSRCPECGTSVNWNESLLRYRTAQKPLFEYRWRDRPIRSFFRTWLLAFRPGRLWRTIDIHDPPQTKPLMIWTMLMAFMATVSLPLGMTLGSFMPQTLRYLTAGPSNWSWAGLEFLLHAFGRSFLGIVFRPGLYLTLVFLSIWWVFSFLALLVFRQSMNLCKVRTGHVFRVIVYAMTTAMPIFVFSFFFLGALMRFGRSSRPTGLEFYPLLNLFLQPHGLPAIVFLLFVVWSIRQGYRKYIKMPHSGAVAIASQAIAILATISIPPVVLYLINGTW